MGAPELLALSLGLSVVVATLAWAGGRLVERLSADPGLRDRVWAAALFLPALPPLVVGLMLLTPAPVRDIPLAAASQPTTVVAAPRMAEAAAAPTAFAFDPVMAAWVVLGTAGLLVGARLVALALRARRLARVIRQAEAPAAEMTTMVEAVARDFAVRAPRVGISAATPEALLAGPVRAWLILPAGLTATGAAPAVIAHELAHLKRGDHRALWLEEALLALLAANPLMPVLRARRAAAREEACDALALAGAAPETRRAYAETLIEALRSRAGPRGLPALTFTGAGRRTAMRRLKAVMTPPAAATGRLRLTALGLGGLVAVLAGAGSLAVAGEREAVTRVWPAPAEASAAEQRGMAATSREAEAVQIADTEPGQSALTPDQQERFRNPTGPEFQAICASTDPVDDGFCAGVIFSQIILKDRMGDGSLFCLPADLDGGDEAARRVALGQLVTRSKAEISRLAVQRADRAGDLVRSALARAYPCAAEGADGFQAEIARTRAFVPLTVATDIEGRPLVVQEDEVLRVVLTDENGAVMNTFGTLNTTGRASDPLGPFGMAIAPEDFPDPGETTRVYTLTGEIRGPDRVLRYVAEPVIIRLAPGSRPFADLRPTLSFRPA